MARYAISQPVTQVEAPRLLTGNGRYTDDVQLQHQTCAVFLRSPHAHADISNIDCSEAKSMPGVLTILTGEDYKNDQIGDLSGLSPMRKRDGSPMYRPPRPALTRDRVRHVGQSVAIIVAETVNQAKDAAETIKVDYVPLPFHLSSDNANHAETPSLWPECSNNEPLFAEYGDEQKVETVLKNAPHVIRQKFIINRVAGSTMEPRAVVASFDSGKNQYTIYACHQRPYIWRTMMTQNMFNIPEHGMRLIAGDVGGSFGMKGGLYPEVPLIAWASERVGRPVRWTCERSESLLSDDQARDMVVEAELGLDSEGHFLGMRLKSQNNVGAYITMIGFISTNGIANSMCGVYTTPALHGQAAAVLTNTVPVSNYRAPGGAPGTYVLERIIDIAAHKIGLDPTEIRRRNIISSSAMPYNLPTTGVYDCGEFEIIMDKCLKIADYVGSSQRIETAKILGKLRGIGVSTTVDPSAGPSPETAELRFDPGGTVTVLVGSTAGGQSHETIYTQIVSERLGIEAEDIRVIEGDTEKLSWGTGTGAARTATIGGTVVFKAVDKIIAKGKQIAAHLLEAAEPDIEFKDGAYIVSGTDKSIVFKDVAKTAFVPSKLAPDIEIGLYETATWSPDQNNTPNSCHVCEVEIAPETGIIEVARYVAVHDVGTELNPLLVEGQVHGGIAQGVGQALMENVFYEPDSGQLLTGSFLDYTMPRADNFCNFEIASHPVPTMTNPLGVKGAGECGTVGGLAAMMNAINNALLPLGIENFAMPATPERVWQTIQAANTP